MVARGRAESNEEEGVEAGRVNAKKPASSDCKLEDAVQRAMNDLEREERRDSDSRDLTPPRPVRNGSRSSPGGTAPGGGLDCSSATPARGN
jgi:hypothetical protein